MVGIGHRILQRTIGTGAHDFLGLVGLAPANQRVRHEAGNTQQFAAGRNTQDTGITGMAAAPQAVMGIQFARLDLYRAGTAHLVRRTLACTGAGSTAGGTCTTGTFVLAGDDANAGHTGHAECCSRIEESATSNHARLLDCLLGGFAHNITPFVTLHDLI